MLTSEDIDVTNLVFTAEGPNANSFGSDVERLELWPKSEHPLRQSPIAGCGSDPVLQTDVCPHDQSGFDSCQECEPDNFCSSPRPFDVDGAVSATASLTLNPASAIGPVRARISVE